MNPLNSQVGPGSLPRVYGPWIADPALIVIAIFTALSALLTQPFSPMYAFANAQAKPVQRAELPLIHMRSDDTVTIDGEAVAKASIPGHIESLVGERRFPGVYFRADDATSFRDARQILALVRLGGAQPLLLGDSNPPVLWP